MLLLRLEDIEHAKFTAHMHMLVDHKLGLEAMEEYFKIAFPYVAEGIKEQEEAFKKRLVREIEKGPLRVSPLMENKPVSSKLHKVVRRNFEKENRVLRGLRSPVRGTG